MTEEVLPSFGAVQRWTLFALGLLLSFFYIAVLTLTVLNVFYLKGRAHTTRVLFRSQFVMIIIESFRLVAAALCVLQVFYSGPNLNLVFDVAVVTGQFMSITFAFAQCIHLSELILFFEESNFPERKMLCDQRRRNLRISALVLIGILSAALLVIISLEVFLHLQVGQAETWIHQGQYAAEVIFFFLATCILSHLYKRLTKCFSDSQIHQSQIA